MSAARGFASSVAFLFFRQSCRPQHPSFSFSVLLLAHPHILLFSPPPLGGWAQSGKTELYLSSPLCGFIGLWPGWHRQVPGNGLPEQQTPIWEAHTMKMRGLIPLSDQNCSLQSQYLGLCGVRIAKPLGYVFGLYTIFYLNSQPLPTPRAPSGQPVPAHSTATNRAAVCTVERYLPLCQEVEFNAVPEDAPWGGWWW